MKKIKFFLKKEILEGLKKVLDNRKQSAGKISRAEELPKQKKKKKKVFGTRVSGILEGDMLLLSNLIESEKERRRRRLEILGWEVRNDSSPDKIYVVFRIVGILMFPGPVPEKEVTGGFEKTIKLKKIQDEIQFVNKKYEAEFIIGYERKHR